MKNQLDFSITPIPTPNHRNYVRAYKKEVSILSFIELCNLEYSVENSCWDNEEGQKLLWAIMGIIAKEKHIRISNDPSLFKLQQSLKKTRTNQ